MLLDKIKSEIDTHEIISFDIFDTLLIRPYVKPTDIFKHIEKVEKKPGFYQNRIAAEKAARKKYFQYDDITLNEIYELMSNEYRDFKDKELKWEERVLQPNPQMKKIFEYAKNQGKKIIIISDMYLPENELEYILKSKGYAGFFKIYVSSKYRKSKGSGRLFRKVIQDLKVHPSEILHLGDNFHSDYDMPHREGMDAFHTHKPLDILIEKDIRIQSFLKEHPDDLNMSILVGLASFIYASEEKNYWKIIGFKYGGPAILGYMNWLKKQLVKSDFKDVWFIARDGYTLQKVFNLLDQKKEFHTSYVYAPRVFNNLFYFPYADIYKTDKSQGLSVVKQIINYYKDMDPTLKNESPQNITSYEQGVSFIEKHFSTYQKLAEKGKKEYLKYLSPQVHSKKIATVDTISAYLSGQRFLSKMLESFSVSVKGYYWGIIKSAIDISEFEKYSYQKEWGLIFDDWDIMEFLITSPEPPINGLKNNKPEYKKFSPEEKVRTMLYPWVSEGAIEFAKIALKCFDDTVLNFTAEEIAAWIDKFTTIPTKWEKNYIHRLKHAYDSANENYVPICKSWWKSKLIFQSNNNVNSPNKINQKYTLYLFKLIQLLKIKNKNNTRHIFVLGIPLFTIKKKHSKIVYRLLGIPIISIRYEGDYYLFDIIPTLKIRKKLINQ